jgi:phospholipase/carboxylesterase
MIQTNDGASFDALGLKHKYQFSSDPCAPLVFLVHGRAGTYDVMWAFRRILPEHCSIIAPQAPEPDMLGGYSWWDVENGRAPEAACANSTELLWKFLHKSLAYYSRSPRGVLALGFSQGAGILSKLVQHEPEFFAGVALLAGFVITSDHSLPANTKLPPVLMIHGSKDDIIPVADAQRGRDYLVGKGFKVRYHDDPVGHKIGSPGMPLLGEWVKNTVTGAQP